MNTVISLAVALLLFFLAWLYFRVFKSRQVVKEVLKEELDLQAKAEFNKALRNPHRSNKEKRRIRQRSERARLSKKGLPK